MTKNHNCWGKEEECTICLLNKITKQYKKLDEQIDNLNEKIDSLCSVLKK